MSTEGHRVPTEILKVVVSNAKCILTFRRSLRSDETLCQSARAAPGLTQLEENQPEVEQRTLSAHTSITILIPPLFAAHSISFTDRNTQGDSIVNLLSILCRIPPTPHHSSCPSVGTCGWGGGYKADVLLTPAPQLSSFPQHFSGPEILMKRVGSIV